MIISSIMMMNWPRMQDNSRVLSQSYILCLLQNRRRSREDAVTEVDWITTYFLAGFAPLTDL
jgi:hypothetical protein